MSEKISTFATLTPELYEDFNKVDFTKSERNHALKFLDNLMVRSYRECGMIDSFIETPKNYFRKVFNSHYLKWLNKLISSNIILCNNSYSNNINNIYSKSYSINNIYTSSPLMWLTFEKTHCESAFYEYKKDILTGDSKDNFNSVVEDFSKLLIDRKGLLNLASKEIEKVDISIFKINDDIEKKSVCVTYRDFGKELKRWMTKEQAIIKATEDNKLLIQDDNNFYILHEYEFLLKKKTAMFQSYQDSINKLWRKKYFANRNTTNNRLDTNLTNLSKKLADKICFDNGLIQFDLCNAQFAILSSILESELKTEDFSRFKQHSYEGTLYEHIMDELFLKDRNQAKKMMFELMFSKENYKSPLKVKLKTIFPSVVEIVDKYKKEKGYNNFSVMLQKRESEIFIDGLWKYIKHKKLFCMTKHDCLIVKESDEKEIEKIIKDFFKKINFKGKIIKE